MTVLKQGNLTLEANAEAVRFQIAGSKLYSVIPAEELGEVIAFLLGHSRRGSNWEEQRTGFRVPLTEDVLNGLTDSFRVELFQGRKHYPVNPKNLSLTGILVEGEAVSRFILEERIIVRLELGQVAISLQGIVRRNPDQLLGIEFPQTRNHEELDPPDELVAIFKLLESSWLKYRVPT